MADDDYERPKVWVLAWEHRDDDGYRPQRVDVDYGWFATEAEAQAFADYLNEPHKRAYETQQAKYEEQSLRHLDAESRKQRVLAEAGIRHTIAPYGGYKPRTPDEFFVVVEIEPNYRVQYEPIPEETQHV